MVLAVWYVVLVRAFLALWGVATADRGRIPRAPGDLLSRPPAGSGTATGRSERSEIEREPRPIATMPDWTSSRIPNGSRILSTSAILALLPITWTVTASVATSTTLARNSWTTSRIWPRVSAVAATLTRISSRCTDASWSSSTILITSISLLSCLVTCSSGESSTLTTMVIRETSACSVGPTASDSMLKPRRLNSPAMRARTPGLFSTRTDRVWMLIRDRPRRTGARGRART